MEYTDLDAQVTTLQTLEILLNLSARRVQQLANDGIIIKHGRGKYDLTKSVINYCVFLQDGNNDNKSDFNLENTRLTKERADAAEMENAKNRGELKNWNDVVLLNDEIAQIVITALSSIPNRTCSTIAAQTRLPVEQVRELLENEINDIRIAIAKELSDHAERQSLLAEADSQTLPTA